MRGFNVGRRIKLGHQLDRLQQWLMQVPTEYNLAPKRLSLWIIKINLTSVFDLINCFDLALLKRTYS